MKLLLGCDPEVFVREKGKKRFFTSAHGLNGGTKENPERVEGGAVQVDGMALEFNIDPASNEDEWYNNIKKVMGYMQNTLPSNLEIVATPVAHFTKKHLAEQPEEARELGCTPDFNAWNGGKANPRPNADVTFRTGAGHIHFGWCEDADIKDPAHLDACMILVRAMDLIVAPLCCLFDEGTKRRQLYGAAGAFRPKPYGVEYRVLSNAWLRDEETIRWVYRASKYVFDKLVVGELIMLNSTDRDMLLQLLRSDGVSEDNKTKLLNRASVMGIPLLESMK